MKSRKKIRKKLYGNLNFTLFNNQELPQVNKVSPMAERKIIVLDCDNTLWKGACAEVGPDGVEIPKELMTLQQFMIKKHKQGVLLCLCSRNLEEDVLAVFRNSNKMLIRLEHISAYKINWNKKSENIRLLAQELQMDLKNFIFIDDNEVECQDVLTELPEVLTLQLPRAQENIPNFLIDLDISISGSLQDHKQARYHQENPASKIQKKHTQFTTSMAKIEAPKQIVSDDKESITSLDSFEKELGYSIQNECKAWLDTWNNVSVKMKEISQPDIRRDFKVSDFDLRLFPSHETPAPDAVSQFRNIIGTVVAPQLMKLGKNGVVSSHKCELYSCCVYDKFPLDAKKNQEMIDVECATLRINGVDETYLEKHGVSEYHIMKIFNKFYYYNQDYFKHYACRSSDTRFLSHFCRVLINLKKLNLISNNIIENIIENGDIWPLLDSALTDKLKHGVLNHRKKGLKSDDDKEHIKTPALTITGRVK